MELALRQNTLEMGLEYVPLSRSCWINVLKNQLVPLVSIPVDSAYAGTPGPAGAGANSGLPRQGGTAARPSSAAPPDYAARIPTSGPRQILAGSPSRYPRDDACVPRQYRPGSDAGGSGTGTQ